MKKNLLADEVDLISKQWQQLGLETDFNALQITARLLRLGKALENRLGKLHAAFSLKPGEFDVLAALKRAGNVALTPSQLYQSMLLSSGAMTSRLDRLENKHLIQRSHCSRDRRSVKVALTEQGKTLIDQVYPAHFELMASLLSGMTDTDKNQLAYLLKGCQLQVETQSADSE